MSMFRKGIIFAISIITTMAIPLAQIPAMAMEGGTEAFGSVMLPTIKEEIISVDLPTVGDESPFDFYIDPQGLLYETDGIKYGGGVVEEGAYLLFRNHNDGEYDFSRYSDRLSVTNRSTVPVIVKITAKISDIGDLRMDQDGVFDGEDDPAIYLAIVDDEGNERVLSEDGEVSVEVELSSAPSEAYTFQYDESTDTYKYVYQNNGDISFDSYSFGLRGECNANADWSSMSASPRVMITWSVDPVMPDNSDETADDEEEDTARETVDEEVSDEEVLDERDAENAPKEGGEATTDDEQKDTGIKSDDSTGTENNDSSDAIKENSETSDTDSDKTTDEQTDPEQSDSKTEDSEANSDEGSTDSKNPSAEEPAKETTTTGDSGTENTSDTTETQGNTW